MFSYLFNISRSIITYFLLLQNFLALCASGFYNGCNFHRNIKGFMVQTGDPTGARTSLPLLHLSYCDVTTHILTPCCVFLRTM